MTKIKICGLYERETIWTINEERPDYCGFIINFPKSHRNVSPEQVQALTGCLYPEVCKVGVIVDQPVTFAADLIKMGIVDIVQLHGKEDNEYIKQFRSLLDEASDIMQYRRETPYGDRIWKAFKIRSVEDIEHANKSLADRVVLDNGYGTGKVFDWNLLKGIQIRDFLLAGGLKPENIPDAIKELSPWGIDISSGVETEKRKDKEKIRAAIIACRR